MAVSANLPNDKLLPTLWELYLKAKEINHVDEKIHSFDAVNLTYSIHTDILEAITECKASTPAERRIKSLALLEIIKENNHPDDELCLYDRMELKLAEQLAV